MCWKMGPKKKVVDARAEEESASEGDSIGAFGSPESPGSSAGTSSTVTTDHLHLILEANQRAMASLIASMHHLAAPVPVPLVPKVVKIPVPKWEADNVPSEFFATYEQAQTHNGVDKAVWGNLLPVYLIGKAKAAFFQLDPVILSDYQAVKNELLIALGDTPAEAGRKWWTTVRQSGEEIIAFCVRLRTMGMRMLDGAETRAEVVERVVLSRFLYLLPSDCYTQVAAQKPKTTAEASRMAQEFEGTRAFARRSQDRRSYSSYNSSQPLYKREQGSGVVNSNGGNASNSQWSQGSSRSASPPQGSQGGGQAANYKSDRADNYQNRERRPITCYGCGELGHIKPNCPNKVRRVKPSSPRAKLLVDGTLAGNEVTGMRIDTGADWTVVDSEFVPQSAFTGKSIYLDSWRGGQMSKHKLARIKVKVGMAEMEVDVAVAEDLDCPALLGNDLGEEFLGAMLIPLLTKTNRVEVEASGVSSTEEHAVRATRAQEVKQKAEEAADLQATAQSPAEPVPLSDIFDFDQSYFENEVEPTLVEECDTLPGVDGVDIPLPNFQTTGSGTLAAEQLADASLTKSLELAKKGEKGYDLVDGIIVHCMRDELDEAIQRVVVPVTRRRQVLQLAHGGLTAGHFGVKKTFSRLSRLFLWPRMWIEAKKYVRECAGCQLAARNSNSKAPLQPLPCVHEPFQKVAFDLVGPLPVTSSGYRYILTMMDLYSKYPAAVPLKRVDNITVLDAMFQVFSDYGIPNELLTDQGSVFTSKLTKAMCTEFGIGKIQTSPYHPQSDGALERWHACLKGMLKRSQVNLKKWDVELKYLLFAYRCTPHCVTGFAPFTLMYGRDVRGPLELLSNSWLEGDSESVDVYDWLVSVKAKMKEMSEVVGDREKLAKESMKANYDKGAKLKVFDSGTMVLVRNPRLKSKMGGAWEGPYEVYQKMSPVTYKVQVPGKPGSFKVYHTNMLKSWTSPTSRIHTVAVIHEEEGESESPPGLRLVRDGFVPTADQQNELDAVLDQFSDVLSDVPGRTDAMTLSIQTGDLDPVRSHPYRIPPKWREEVRAQIDQLLDLGIIQASKSPWSSSVVTVKKKDGGIRICVDYRAVNSITAPDPYMMPFIEDILDTLATAKFISKVDLNKGFHQIPVDSVDRQKTAFCTPWGKFEFLRMPFGLRNGPAVFQRLMDQILYQDQEISRVYIDDIAIFSATWEEHLLAHCCCVR